MPDYTFGFSGSWFVDLVYFKGDAIPILVDKEGHAGGHAILDKIVPRPTETLRPSLLSASISSAGLMNCCTRRRRHHYFPLSNQPFN